MVKRTRRTFSNEAKFKLVMRHLSEGVSISEICEEHRIQVTQFYKWRAEFLKNGHKAFETSKRNASSKEAKLEQKLKQKEGVIKELIDELVDAKKNIGEI